MNILITFGFFTLAYYFSQVIAIYYNWLWFFQDSLKIPASLPASIGIVLISKVLLKTPPILTSKDPEIYFPWTMLILGYILNYILS